MKGFTLIEVLVVMAITVVLTGLLVTNFSRTRVDLNQTRLLVQDAIREAQALALSGSLYTDSSPGATESTYRCGYGVHFEPGSYIVYAGPDSSTVDCSLEDRNYDAGDDQVVRTGFFSNNQLEIALPAVDIFFEPPDPVTYINNSSLAGVSTDVVIRRKGANCSQKQQADCRTIHVTTSGLITTQ